MLEAAISGGEHLVASLYVEIGTPRLELLCSERRKPCYKIRPSSISNDEVDQLLPASSYSSVKLSQSLIVNGHNATKGRYPYFVILSGAGALIVLRYCAHGGTHETCKRGLIVQHHVGAYSFNDDDGVEASQIPDMNTSKSVGDDEKKFQIFHDFTILKLSSPSAAPFVKIKTAKTIILS